MTHRTWMGIVVLCIGVVFAGERCPADVPATQAAATRELRSDQLVVTVMEPNDPQRYNRGVRFTPVAAVLGVRRGERTYLFNPADHDPIADHAGLAAEFDLVIPDDANDRFPPGYAEAAVGEGFVKVGVGVLVKQKRPYSLFQNLPVLELAKTTVNWHDDHADFLQRCAGVNGYAYDLSAHLAVKGDEVIVDWTLVNTGTKPITTRQYTHNFIRIGDHDVGPGYTITWPYELKATGLQAEQSQAGRTIRFDRRIPQWVNLAVEYPTSYDGPNTCTVRHEPSGATIDLVTSLPGESTAIHARPQYLSPEQFVVLRLPAGEKTSWRRLYRFH